MRYLKPIRDFSSYSSPIAKAIYDSLYESIYKPLMEILKPVQKFNALANGNPNMIFGPSLYRIHIENPKGSLRKGKYWIQKMAHDYGYICDTEAIDGDEIDCFVGDNSCTDKMFVIEQVKPDTDIFDEYKVMFGFSDIKEAQKAYMANYQKGWTGFKHIHEYPADFFWNWYATTKNQIKLNATFSALEDSLRRGVMEYRDGYFVGPLKASITKELRAYGAVFNHTRKVYYLDISRLPQNILQAIAQGRQASKNMLDKVNAYLRAIEGRDIKAPNIDPFFADIMSKLDKQFYITTKPIVSADLEIPFNPKFAEQIKQAYTQNLEKYIRGWHQEAVLRLREKVAKNTEQGFRAESLISMIKSESGVSQRKAKFLAYQETSLMTASYREIRYKDIGVEKYMWSTSHDERVRPDHRILDGHIFKFDHPPVTNQAKDAKNNPGEDYNCRCVAIPVLSHGINMVREYAENTQ